MFVSRCDILSHVQTSTFMAESYHTVTLLTARLRESEVIPCDTNHTP